MVDDSYFFNFDCCVYRMLQRGNCNISASAINSVGLLFSFVLFSMVCHAFNGLAFLEQAQFAKECWEWIVLNAGELWRGIFGKEDVESMDEMSQGEDIGTD